MTKFNELSKCSFLNDLNDVLVDFGLVLEDHGYNVDDFSEDDQLHQESDIYEIISTYINLKTKIEELL